MEETKMAIDQVKELKKQLKDAANIVDKLFTKLGNISPVSAAEYLDTKTMRNIIVFMLRQGRDDWAVFTENIDIEELAKWPQDAQDAICKYYKVESVWHLDD